MTEEQALQQAITPQKLTPRALAYLGDAVYELYVRTQAVHTGTDNLKKLHDYSTSRVSASFQVQLLEALEPLLTETEADIVRRARNLPVTSNRRSNQALHRQATALEALIGYWHHYTPERLPLAWQHLEHLVNTQ